MIGKTLAHYEITGALGKGGMGEVYRARDTKLGRDVAIKILPAALANDTERLARFEREAKTVAGLNHPHIVTLFSVEQEGDQHYITMELVEGRTLSAEITKEGLPFDRFLEYGIAMADAVASAHRQGITHRDLKPDNIMINGEGRLKVLDFGLAKLHEEEQPFDQQETIAAAQVMTAEGKILGTPAYMSPEQAEGKPADNRSDVFALGILLYEMATGLRPFIGDTPMSTITAILRDTPSSVTNLNQRLPRHLGRIVKRCLEKDPDRRYQTALDVKNELEGLREEVASGEIELPASFGVSRGGGQRHKALISVMAVVTLAAIAFGASQWWTGRATSADPATPLQSMEIRRLTATGNARGPVISQDGRYVAYLADEAGQTGVWVMQVSTSSRIEIVPAAAAALSGLAYSPDGDFIYYIRRDKGAAKTNLFRVPALGGQPRKMLDDVSTKISFAPAGDSVVFARQSSRAEVSFLVVANLVDGTERTLAEQVPPNYFMTPSLSPDGTRVAVPVLTYQPKLAASLWIYDINDGTGQSLGREWFKLEDAVWLPEGDGLVFTGRPDFFSSQIWLMSYPDGELQRVTNDLNFYDDIGLTDGGHTLVTQQRQTSFQLWSVPLDGSWAPRKLQAEDGPMMYPSGWLSDDTVLYSTVTTRTKSPDLWKLDLRGGAPQQVTSWPEVEFNGQVDPQGRYIVFASDHSGTVNIWRIDVDGGNPLRLSTGSLDVRQTFSADGQWVYYLDGQRSRIMKVSVAGGEAVMVSDAKAKLATASPDGRHLAIDTWYEAEGRWRVDIVPADGGDPIQTLDLQQEEGLFWSSDGTALLHDRRVAGVNNVWRTPLDGGEARQLTHFKEAGNAIGGGIMSPDGKTLVVGAGSIAQDIVLLENFR
ncbi:MAG: protein kinase [Candidatus Krumholzibacteria bacterium]|nr:protein kinase [Candidatus Krumholzibacteria bacterium]